MALAFRVEPSFHGQQYRRVFPSPHHSPQHPSLGIWEAEAAGSHETCPLVLQPARLIHPYIMDLYASAPVRTVRTRAAGQAPMHIT